MANSNKIPKYNLPELSFPRFINIESTDSSPITSLSPFIIEFKEFKPPSIKKWKMKFYSYIAQSAAEG